MNEYIKIKILQGCFLRGFLNSSDTYPLDMAGRTQLKAIFTIKLARGSKVKV
jgi:hypothetical protein